MDAFHAGVVASQIRRRQKTNSWVRTGTCPRDCWRRSPPSKPRRVHSKLKPNVLHMIDSFEQGGSERQALQLVRQLHESGRSGVRLSCLQNKGSLRGEADRLGLGEIPEYPLTSFYDRNFVRQLRRLARFLKENEIDVVHTHDFYTNIFGMAAAAMARVRPRLGYKGENHGFRTSAHKRL